MENPPDLTQYQLLFLIHHIILPPKAPQAREADIRYQNSILAGFIAAVCKCYDKFQNLEVAARAIKCLELTAYINDPASDFPERLANTIPKLEPGDAFALHVFSQNAGIIFRRPDIQKLQMEVFEASPTPEAVIQCKGRLVCSFPGPTTTIPWSDALNPRFLKELGAFLHHMDFQLFTDETLSKTRKAGNNLSEIRDCPDPRFIVELFTGMMRGIGREIHTKSVVTKRLRDEVNIQTALNPWRRTGLWLVIRVALQTTLTNTDYKCFILEVIRSILCQSIQLDIDTYNISCISRKLARRAEKLGQADIPKKLMQDIIKSVGESSSVLCERWQIADLNTERKIDCDRQNVQIPNIQINTHLRLENVGPWIKRRIWSYRNRTDTMKEILDPVERKRYKNSSEIPELPSPDDSEIDIAIGLIDFENWVTKNLHRWCSNNANSIDVIEKLSTKIESYHKIAAKAYIGHHILDTSMMVLTILEIWVELDTLLCKKEPLLRKYSPEITSKMLEPLLLVKNIDMKRLLKIEVYLQERHDSADPGYPSIFNSEPSKNGFNSLYFDSDKGSNLRTLKKKITMAAGKERKTKIEELYRKNRERDILLLEASQLSCEYWINNYGRQRHSGSCTKCSVKRKAGNITINVHEWPLPRTDEDMKFVLFELQPPKEFAIWRDITYYIMIEVREPLEAPSTVEYYRLGEWGGLHKFTCVEQHRITIASARKPISGRSHYRNINIPAVESDAIVEHAGVYRLLDVSEKDWINSRHRNSSVKPLCKSVLSSPAYSDFSYAVNGTSHQHNQIIAEQYKCPSILTLREYESFLSLRSGHRLQWFNMLTELRKDDLTFKNDEIYQLFLNAACHVGPRAGDTNWRRESHIALSDGAFCETLLDTMVVALKELKDNWDQANKLKILVLLARRVSSSRSSDVHAKTLEFLNEVRKVCSSWVKSIRLKLKQSSDESAIQGFRHWLLRVSGIQASAFDIDETQLPRVFQNPEDVTEFLVLQILIQQNCLGILTKLPSDLRSLLQENRRFTITAEKYINNNIEKNPSILLGVLKDIQEGKFLGSWQQLPVPSDRWWRLQPISEPGIKALIVHVNILQGKVLIDGEPNGRLPEAYFTHPSYLKILGSKVLEVSPSNILGMSYRTTSNFHGVTLHFQMEGSELIVRKVDKKVHEYIPAEMFDGDLPRPIFHVGSQWLNLGEGSIRFYNNEKWWKKDLSRDDWILRMHLSKFWVMTKDGSYLLEIHGGIHRAASKALNPLESLEYLVTTVNEEGTVVNITLPRYKLQFFINETGRYECYTLKGWVVDDCQRLGVFIGLQNFLKLKETRTHSARQCVIIPFGNIMSRYSEGKEHLKVEIHPPKEDREYTIFRIDKILERVSDDGTLRSRFTRLYLHALTSGVLPDPLTHRTGIQEALDGLRSAASFSFQFFSDKDALILNKIASLSPIRTFYPAFLQKMQEVDWKDYLPTWTQNDEFYPAVEAIFKDWERRKVQIEDKPDHKIIEFGSLDLLERARNHNSVFSQRDQRAYERCKRSRNHSLRHEVGEAEEVVHSIAKSVYNFQRSQDLELNLKELFVQLPELSGFNTDFTFQYSPSLTKESPVETWCTLYEYCRNATSSDKFAILFIFSMFGYRKPHHKKVLKSLLAIAASSMFKDLQIPLHKDFYLQAGPDISLTLIEERLRYWALDYEESEYFILSKMDDDSDWKKEKYEEFEQALENQISCAANAIYASWPNEGANYPPYSKYPLLKISSASEGINLHFEICYHNLLFFQHLEKVISRLYTLNSIFDTPTFFDSSTIYRIKNSKQKAAMTPKLSVSLTGLLARKLPPTYESQLSRYALNPRKKSKVKKRTSQAQAQSLLALPRRLKCSTEPFALHYAKDLLLSEKALASYQQNEDTSNICPTLNSLEKMYEEAKDSVSILFSKIFSSISPKSDMEKLQRLAWIWPDITKLDILRRLQLKNRRDLTPEWLGLILKLGEAITIEQRASRLLRLAEDQQPQDFEIEAKNVGRQNWKSEDHIDWLLLEIDSNMLIRDVQASIGFSMMDEQGGNKLMQLNMGEGKSAVIVPAVAAALADRTRLVRVVVLKTLSNQMFEILSQKLGGLCDRKVYCVPFKRGLSFAQSHIEELFSLYKDCMESGGILLTLPEYILSFKLIGIERMIQGEEEIARPLIEVQEWLQQNTRDILDESDEILHTRYQLIYTMGKQQVLEGGRDRWLMIQQALELVQRIAIEMLEENPTALEIGRPNGVQYRQIRIIDRAVGEKLLKNVATEICKKYSNKAESISSKLRLLPSQTRDLALKFISVRKTSVGEQETILNDCSHLKIQLLVLRGLIAHGVLLFVLSEKRYRVDYGLDKSRSNLAVPYRAKDRPAVKSEFGHPEGMLTMTCLAYYYGGLTKDDLEQCFVILRKMNSHDLIYETWLETASCYVEVPMSLSKLGGLNFSDEEQVNEVIFPFFQYNKSVIDFFLSEFIFPREAKGFPLKLSTSGWDLAERKRHNTTGFSGTNDNKYLLSTSIRQLDLPEQLHTNSLVLKHILKKENNRVIKGEKGGFRLSAEELLEKLVALKSNIQVLLDVGAQILELTNQEVAKKWLSFDKSEHIWGAVYFGENDRLLVMRRDGKVENFASSPLATSLDRVLVYLDEAHTRGTDLKLPEDAKAAVTLGPNLAKDKLVQGCMRMRKLGNKQSLLFIAPPDIYAQIQTLSSKTPKQLVEVTDVLYWAMNDSCRQIQGGFATWANQGFQYLKRKAALSELKKKGHVKHLEAEILAKENISLLELYGFQSDSPQFNQDLILCEDSKAIFAKLEAYNVCIGGGVAVHEEQEREVDHEVEEQRSNQLPKPAQASKHNLDSNLEAFVQHGKLNVKYETFCHHAFDTFAKTSARDLTSFKDWEANIYATHDFGSTIQNSDIGNLDDYLRPARWLMTARDTQDVFILSPFEANELMPKFRKSNDCSLHIYAPRVTKRMQTFEFLDFCTISGSPQNSYSSEICLSTRALLNIFAGQLFFHDMKYYSWLCNYLGLYYGPMKDGMRRGSDGWVAREIQKQPTLASLNFSGPNFGQSPIPFLTEITKMRRKGQSFSLTHWGGVLDARELKEL